MPPRETAQHTPFQICALIDEAADEDVVYFETMTDVMNWRKSRA